MDIFKPLMVFRKYIIAHDVLRIISNPTIYLTEGISKKGEPKQEVFKIGFQQFPVSIIIEFLPDVHILRIIEAIDILSDNKHIEVRKNEDMNLYDIWCTKSGEIAFNDGYYYRKSIIVGWKIIAGIAVAISGAVIAVVRWVT